MIALPAGFDRFVAEAGEPARAQAFPPPAPPDVAKLEATGAKYGIETVGPPVRFDGTPNPEHAPDPGPRGLGGRLA